MRDLGLALTALAFVFVSLALIATTSLPSGRGAIVDHADRQALDALVSALTQKD